MVEKDEAIEIAKAFILKTQGGMLPLYDATYMSESTIEALGKMPPYAKACWAVSFESLLLDSDSTPSDTSTIVIVDAKTGTPIYFNSL